MPLSLEDLGNLGEFLGLFAILITLVYLARQTRQSVDITKGTEQRTLIDQFNVYLRVMTEPQNLEAIRDALVSYRKLDANAQARAFGLLAQWVNHYEQSRYAFQSGLLPAAVLNAFENFTLAFLVTPGGEEFWQDYRHVFGRDVGGRLDELISDPARRPPPITETYPWLRSTQG
jgi:hypothetical protein